MRNIKSTLRIARNSALLFVAASGVTYLTGCQSENGLNPDNSNVPESNLKTASYSVHGANQGRVTNYGVGSTRAGEYVEATETFDMPESVTIPEGAFDLNGKYINEANSSEWYTDWKEHLNYGKPAAGTYYIAEGATTDSGLDFGEGPSTLYVAGTLNASYLKGNATVYVLPGGTLKYAANPMTSEPGVTIYNYGNIKGDCVCFAGKLYSAVDITEAKVFGVNEGAELFSKGSITATEVRLNGNAAACAFIADNIDIHSVGTIKTSYFQADNLTLNSGNVVLDNNGLVDVKNLFVSNADTRFTVNGTNAVVYAENFATNNITWPKNTFGVGIACKFDNITVGGEKKSFNELELQYSSSDQVAYVPAAGCHGSFEYDNETGEPKRDDETSVPPVKPEDPIVEIKKIVDIEGLDDEINHGDHDHGIISATCITFGADGTAYASYHLRGYGKGDHNQPNYVGEYAQKGCIEVIKDNGEAGMELGSYMIAPDWDFNHLIVDGNRIVTVGNAKKMSAFIGTLPVTFEASGNADREDFQVRELTTNEPIYGTSDKTGEQIKIGFKNAGDGNCVVRQGDYYYVATYQGYGPLTLDFGRVNDKDGNKIFHSTPGSCKHISVSGDKMAVLAHDTYDPDKSTASLYMFNASDYSFANQLAKYDNVGTIEPVDGKNVIAIDGNDVYVCLSKGGLARYTNGALNGTFQRGANKQVPVNGMAFDDKYIYVANGSFVSVLDKETMNEICYYHAASQKSANYIALRNGKIYVAFGEDGIQVFQLVEKEITL